MKIYRSLVTLSILTFTLTSCFEKEVTDNKDEARELRRQAELAELMKKKAELDAKQAEEEARMEAQAKLEAQELEAQRLAEEKELQRKLEEEKIAAEKEARRVAILERQHRKQKEACADYVGTQFEELNLLTGKTLKSVKVTNANHEYVSMMHSGGVANVKYADLPAEVGKACKYDTGLESWLTEKEALEAKSRAEAKAAALAEAGPKSTTRATSKSSPNMPRYSSAKNTGKAEPKAPVVPKGYIKVRIVRVKAGNKTIEITGIANVDSTIYLNDYTWSRYYNHQVAAGEKFTKVWSSVGSKYDVKLKANSGGQILDREAHNKKSGLGGVDGL